MRAVALVGVAATTELCRWLTKGSRRTGGVLDELAAAAVLMGWLWPRVGLLVARLDGDESHDDVDEHEEDDEDEEEDEDDDDDED